MENLSIVIPYRFKDNHRHHLFQWIHSRYGDLYPLSPLIIADSDEDEAFSRSQARNNAVDNVETEYILIGDADTLSFNPFVRLGIDLLEDGAGWVIPYGVSGYFNLRNPYSNKVMAMSPDVFITPENFEWQHQIESWAGQLLMKTETFYTVNGYDERFIGWGYEDNAFQRAMDTIVGPFKRVESGWTAHLWHPEQEHDRWKQPFIKTNEGRMHHYNEAVGDKEAMREVVKGNRDVPDI